jgi:hypothetical protein
LKGGRSPTVPQGPDTLKAEVLRMLSADANLHRLLERALVGLFSEARV